MKQKNNSKLKTQNLKLCIVGLGYVGLPLAVEFGKKFQTIGFDVNKQRINELKSFLDKTLEVSSDEIKEAKRLSYTNKIKDTSKCNYYIITVPTPIDEYNRPNLSPLLSASRDVGKVLSKGDIVIYESTVYPGATEEDCVPILEKESGLHFNKDFFVGYSPERINPGDKKHRLTTIKKVTSGSTKQAAIKIDNLYKSIISAGTHQAPSIRVAEAAKVIENTQRDINIAFVNELYQLFDKLNIPTDEVLKAASTKWNFLSFKPGLVGGHCIGVDPYYLTHKAESIGHHPQMILAGRRINDNMPKYVANKLIKKMIKKGNKIDGSKVLVMGITFKENCPDIRNSKVIDVIRELESFGCLVDVTDPWADANEVKQEYGISLIENGEWRMENYDAVFVAVGHREFEGVDLKRFCKKSVVFDLRGD